MMTGWKLSSSSQSVGKLPVFANTIIVKLPVFASEFNGNYLYFEAKDELNKN